MKRFYLFIGYAIGFSIPAAFVYGFYLLNHGLGWIVGSLVAMWYVHYFSPEQKARRAAAINLAEKREEIKERIDDTIKTARPPVSEIRRREIN